MHFISLIMPMLPLEIPNPSPSMPPGFDNFKLVIAWAKWVALGLLAIEVIVVAVMMTSDRHGHDYMSKFGKIAVGAILVTAGIGIVSLLAGA